MLNPLRHMVVTCVALLLLMTLSRPAAATDVPSKKFIQLGWDIPNTAFLRTQCQEMEASAPFDGVIFSVEYTDDQARTWSSLQAWDTQPWQRAWLQSAVDDLHACQFTKFTDNFLRVNVSPGNLDWGDDAGWTVLSEKIADFAWLAKQGKAKGLAVDFESYRGKQFQFDPSKPQSFAKTAALVRRRGAELIRGIAHEFPDAVVLGLWLNSVNFRVAESTDPETLLAVEAYGLLPAFINGMLDALPPMMTLVDGCEFGYYYDGIEEYLRAAAKIRSWSGPASRLVAPENRTKWRAQGQVGFGFYLDMYLNKPGNRFYFGPKPGGTRLERLRDNLAAARSATDQYVWIFGEQAHWWKVNSSPWVKEKLKMTVGQGKHWEEAMPRLTEVITQVKDPVTAAWKSVNERRQRNSARNLVRNADFLDKNLLTGLPTHFGTWQAKSSHGEFLWDGHVGDGAVRITDVRRGSVVQKVPVQAGQRYFVEASSRTQGNGVPSLTIRWQRTDGTWMGGEADATFVFPPGQDQWQQASGFVDVPRGATQLVLLLSVASQLSEDDTCWFDNVRVQLVE